MKPEDMDAEIAQHHEAQMRELRQRFAAIIQSNQGHDVEHSREGSVLRVVASDGLSTKDYVS